MSDLTWVFTADQLKKTPSRNGGLTENEENRERRNAIKILTAIGKDIQIKVCPTIATASVYFHRFYMFHSMSDYPPTKIALAALFLAGKVEETPKKCKDVLHVAKEKFPNLYGQDTVNDLVNYEKILLHTNRFDLQLFHPYNKVIEYISIFDVTKEQKSHLSTTAWTFINDSYCTTLCLMWEPELITIAVIEMALCMEEERSGLVRKYKDQAKNKFWWENFVGNLSQSQVDLICHQLLDYYWLVQSEDMEDSV